MYTEQYNTNLNQGPNTYPISEGKVVAGLYGIGLLTGSGSLEFFVPGNRGRWISINLACEVELLSSFDNGGKRRSQDLRRGHDRQVNCRRGARDPRIAV